jgi:DNA-directed RNA polymerase
VNKHLDEIIASPENDLWLKADEPLMFLACALELKGFVNNPKEFVSRLPILLDATCNGLQHLSAMTCDIHLAQRVNITKSTIYNNPRDIYSELLPAIKEKVLSMIEKDKSISNLKYLNITRKLVKRGIMTITYGVTKKGILDQLLSEHFYKSGLENKHYTYKTKDDSMGDFSLTYKDLQVLSGIIYDVLFDSHEVLKKFVEYFDGIVDLMNNLNLPLQ